MVGIDSDDRLMNRDVALVMAATFCFIASNMLISPLMAGFSESLGAGGALMGVVAAMMNVVSLFCRPIAGNLADRTSKRTLVGIGAALYLVSSVWYALAGSPASLIAARMVNGVGFACCSVCLATWMAMLLPIRHMGAGMGLYGTMNALAMAIGPAVGIRAQQLIGYRCTFLISTVLAALMMIAVLFVRNGGHPIRQGGADAAGTDARPAARRFTLRAIVEPRVVPLSLVFMCFSIPYFANQSFLVEVADARGLDVDVSLFFPLYAAALLVLRLAFRNLFDTKPFRLFFIVGTVAMVGMLLCLALMRNDWVLLLGAVLTAFSYGMMSSVTQAEAVVIAGQGAQRHRQQHVLYRHRPGHVAGAAAGRPDLRRTADRVVLSAVHDYDATGLDHPPVHRALRRPPRMKQDTPSNNCSNHRAECGILGMI